MSRRQILLLLSLFTFFLTCEKDAPYIPESYKLLPQSDVPIIASDWHYCSIPISPGKDLQSRSQLFWWNPYEMVHINEIWSTIELSPDVPNRIHVLYLFFIPNKNLSSPEESWNGVILYLSDESTTTAKGGGLIY